MISGRRKLEAAPGLIHMRMALVEDANFDTTAQPPRNQNWDYAFRFVDAGRELIVAVDSVQGLICNATESARQAGQIAAITPISQGMQRFLREQFKTEKKIPLSPASTETKPRGSQEETSP
jgi:hypothetical protein